MSLSAPDTPLFEQRYTRPLVGLRTENIVLGASGEINVTSSKTWDRDRAMHRHRSPAARPRRAVPWCQSRSAPIPWTSLLRSPSQLHNRSRKLISFRGFQVSGILPCLGRASRHVSFELVLAWVPCVAKTRFQEVLEALSTSSARPLQRRPRLQGSPRKTTLFR